MCEQNESTARVMALTGAARRAGEKYGRGSVLFGAPSHSGADLLTELEAQGWSLVHEGAEGGTNEPGPEGSSIDQCPTCGSDDPAKRGWVTAGPPFYNHPFCKDDQFHSPPVSVDTDEVRARRKAALLLSSNESLDAIGEAVGSFRVDQQDGKEILGQKLVELLGFEYQGRDLFALGEGGEDA